VLADDQLQCGPLQVFLVKIHCETGLTGIGAASIIVSSEIAEFEELDGDLVEGFELSMARSVFLPGPARRQLMA